MGLTTLKADCEMPITEHGFCWPAVNYERSTSSNGGSTGANTKRELTQTIAGRMLDGSKRVFGLIVENVCNLTGYIGEIRYVSMPAVNNLNQKLKITEKLCDLLL